MCLACGEGNVPCLVIEILKGYKEICVCGDGRNDSPGHSARYCVYTLMEHVSKVVVNWEVIDKRETGRNSAVMEREGLRRLLERLMTELPLNELCTDASSTVIKLVKDMKGNMLLILSTSFWGHFVHSLCSKWLCLFTISSNKYYKKSAETSRENLFLYM